MPNRNKETICRVAHCIPKTCQIWPKKQNRIQIQRFVSLLVVPMPMSRVIPWSLCPSQRYYRCLSPYLCGITVIAAPITAVLPLSTSPCSSLVQNLVRVFDSTVSVSDDLRLHLLSGDTDNQILRGATCVDITRDKIELPQYSPFNCKLVKMF